MPRPPEPSAVSHLTLFIVLGEEWGFGLGWGGGGGLVFPLRRVDTGNVTPLSKNTDLNQKGERFELFVCDYVDVLLLGAF